jgi:predicted RNA binding protein YcfA (HicA-like mRNA interferase family)
VARKKDLPRVLNQQKAKKLLVAEGWTETLGGKHSVKMEKEGFRPITLPMHHGEDYAASLASAILRKVGLKRGSDDESAD